MSIVNIINSFSVKIRVYGDENNPLFVASDVGKLLEITNIRASLITFNDDERIKITVLTRGGNQKMIALTLCGLYKMISISRTSIAEELRKKINYEFEYYRSIPEPDFINKITRIFSTETFEKQKKCLKYHIDLYMPAHNIAIEFDEEHHRHQQESDMIREQEIKEHLGCTLIRVKWDDDIFTAAGQIYAHIHVI